MAAYMKVCIHMPSFWRDSNTERQDIVVKVVNDYLSKWEVKSIDLFIHTNSAKTLEIQTKCIMNTNMNIHYIVYDMSCENPQNLGWKPREMIAAQKDLFDVFLYIENDIGVPFEAFQYWLKYKDIFHKNEIDIGFVRVETTDEREYFCTDILMPSLYPVHILDRTFVWNHQNYCAFWICDRPELDKFINSIYWNYNCFFPDGPDKPSSFILETAAIGFKMAYKGSFHPLDNKTVSDICFVHHLTNNYVTSPGTPFGKFAVSRMTELLYNS